MRTDMITEKHLIVRKMIRGEYDFEFSPVSEDSRDEILTLTAIKARIICEGMCTYILEHNGIHLKRPGTINDFISTIINLSDYHPEFKKIISDLRVIQVKCNMFAHFQLHKSTDYKDVQILLTSLYKLEDWFIDNYKNQYNENKEEVDDNIIVSEQMVNKLLEKSSFDLKAEFEKTLSDAEHGSVKAMYEIANMYFYGIIIDKEHPGRNLDKAAEWFKKLSEVNSTNKDYDDFYKAYGMRYLGHMYYGGTVPFEKQSYKKCFQLFSDAVKLSNTAIPHLAYMYLIGSGCKADITEAEKLYESTIQNGDPNCIIALARLYRITAQYEKAVSLYEMICDKFPAAAFELGMLYKDGFASEAGPDYFRASLYFDIAINAEYSEAAAYLEKGKMYFNPTGGFIQNFNEAERCFRKSADMGNYEACYMLGYMYQNKHVASADDNLAITYHKKAAFHGNSNSAVALAEICQQNGDYRNALTYARLSYNMGSPEGSFIYGNMLMIGIGCEPDLYEAQKAYDYALEHGCTQASFMKEKMAQCYKR